MRKQLEVEANQRNMLAQIITCYNKHFQSNFPFLTAAESPNFTFGANHSLLIGLAITQLVVPRLVRA